MDSDPRTIAELKSWLARRGADPKTFAVDWEPDWEGFYVQKVPRYWSINVKNWPALSVHVRCDTEADLCECYVELVNGRDRDAGSKTRRIQDDVWNCIEQSWQMNDKEDQQS
jgi:hypothetical protein